jgi:hypothetical protein
MDEHQTFRRAGVRHEDHWVFRPGQRVMTVGRIAGTVTDVQSGPVGGAESYIVVLDDDLGGGAYSSSQLQALASLSITAAVASEDYPELTEILVERPPLEHSVPVVAPNSMMAWLVTDPQGTIYSGPHSSAIEARLALNQTQADDLMLVTEAEWQDRFDGDHRRTASLETDAGIRDWLLQKGKEWGENPARGHQLGNDASYDWCRFRRRQQCYYPRKLNDAASLEAGYPVWIPEHRGYCPRDSWKDQKACPAPSEPGPNSKERRFGPDATISWEEGGQRMPEGAMWATSNLTLRREGTCTYRKTKLGEWVVYGPSSEVRAGATVTVHKANGDVKTETIVRIGTPFDVGGVEHVYGYLGDKDRSTRSPAQPRGRGRYVCDECGSWVSRNDGSVCWETGLRH